MSGTRYSKRVLLAAAGLSPQVVTETIYAQHAAGAPVPTEVHVISTSEGAERTRLSLLSREPGWFKRLVDDYSLPQIDFSEKNIHVLKDESGAALSDIRKPEDNRQAANTILELVKGFTEDPDASLHVSIAGGRKTMGFYLGYALLLYGRSQDRLTHVLVDNKYESAWDFFYPTPYSKTITVKDNELADTSKASVILADIPLVSLRDRMPESLNAKEIDFEHTVKAANEAISQPFLTINLDESTIQTNTATIEIQPAQLALLAAFAREKLVAGNKLRAPPKGVPDLEWGNRYMAERSKLSESHQDIQKARIAYRDGLSGEEFSSLLSKLRRTLRSGLGAQGARPYLIDDSGTRPKLYSLDISKSHIKIV